VAEVEEGVQVLLLKVSLFLHQKKSIIFSAMHISRQSGVCDWAHVCDTWRHCLSARHCAAPRFGSTIPEMGIIF
jgi:hypothetical protein